MPSKLTNENFIKRAKEIHNNKYNYSKVNYISSKEKVCIICPEHGEFWQTPDNHLHNKGCPKCAKLQTSSIQTLTTDDFIKKAKDVHGDKYDYSKVNYINNRIKVCIICPIHGEFWQIPTNHLKGEGCPKCGRKQTSLAQSLTTDEFIEKAKGVHGDKYDYSKVNYISSKKKVCIICPIHGEFWQTPDNHCNNQRGCPQCGREQAKKSNTNTTEYFIQSARKIHGNKYDYSKVEYVNNYTKVCIICPKHGEFWQTPQSHINNSSGCPICARLSANIKMSSDTNEFIERAKIIHVDKYDYSKVNYISSKEKVCIICPIHGEFWQTPDSHLKGCGCPKCKKNYPMNTETFIERAKKIHGDKYDYSKVNYVNIYTKVCIICSEHGEFWQTPLKHLEYQGCPKCSQSGIESVIDTFLTENKIEFIYECNNKTLKWLNKLRLDFYLLDYNIAIECQGLQHFKARSCFGGEKALESQIERDKKKKKLCDENNVRLIYFSNIKNLDKDIITDLNDLLTVIKKQQNE